jgi:hypothetical protein
MKRFSSLVSLGIVLSLCVSTMPAQAVAVVVARTWVSGVGNDGNPCSRTAPCLTLAHALTVTIPGGEIDVLDPAGLGSATITQAVTIDGGGGFGSVLVSGQAGITINAGPNDRVILRNLTITGNDGTGTTGIKFIAAAALTVQNCNIMNFGQLGIDFTPATRASLVIIDSSIENNAQGGLLSSAGSGGVNRVSIVNTSFQRSGTYAIRATTNTDLAIFGGLISTNRGGGVIADGATAQVTLKHTMITNNQAFGLNALNSGIIRFSSTDVSYNNGTGLLAQSGGQILSFGNNTVAGNAPDGTRTGALPLI